jgi:hypothetical protein
MVSRGYPAPAISRDLILQYQTLHGWPDMSNCQEWQATVMN